MLKITDGYGYTSLVMALLSVNEGIELLYFNVYCCQLGLEHNHDIGSRPFLLVRVDVRIMY